ncbi:unnamed protein product [Ilex paraguariensis]|uniref:FF domain-containing protein n=1 Tax=Ilex paraguariensis TaxID=185542 RepID=A0ABC8RMM4_9AQUA
MNQAIQGYSARRALFENYVRTRAEEERKEKRGAKKAAMEEFKQLLEEAKETCMGSWLTLGNPSNMAGGAWLSYCVGVRLNASVSISASHVTHLKYRLVRDMLAFLHANSNINLLKVIEEQLSGQYVGIRQGWLWKEVKFCVGKTILPLKRAAEEKALALRAATASSFRSMLQEKGDICTSSRWSKVKDSLRNDPRYKSVKHEERQALFNEYISSLKAAAEEAERTAKAKRDEENVVPAAFDFDWSMVRPSTVQSSAESQPKKREQ